MLLTTHFTRAQIEHSEVAIRKGIANTIPDAQIAIWTAGLVALVEPLIPAFPDLRISSAFRSEVLNRDIRGSRNSQHCGIFWMDERNPPKHVPCCAFDLILPRDNRKLWQAIPPRIETWDQLIWEFGDNQNPAWVHISWVPNEHNRKQILKAERIDGHVRYSNMQWTPEESTSRLANIVNPQPPVTPNRTIAGGSNAT